MLPDDTQTASVSILLLATLLATVSAKIVFFSHDTLSVATISIFQSDGLFVTITLGGVLSIPILTERGLDLLPALSAVYNVV